MTKDLFVSILKAAGITEAQMKALHANFEAKAPAEHQQFLEFLQIPAGEISQIRKWSREG